MINCKLINTALTFEYSTVDVNIISHIDSIMNPITGKINAISIGELIMDKTKMDPLKTKIITNKSQIINNKLMNCICTRRDRMYELPMWVADMDFETAPEIIEVLHQRVDHGIFGYNIVPDAYFESIQNWWYLRHHYKMKKEWMMFCTRVVPAISSIVKKVTTVGENVLILAPVYNIFYNSILNNGRHVLSSDLIYDWR